MPGRSFLSEAYRYGYQGSERDPEMSGGAGYTTFFRALDPRIGRWLTPDPKVFPWQSPYVSMDGNPIFLNDQLGAETGGGSDAIHSESVGSIPNLISGVDVVVIDFFSNKLLLSGDANRPERFPVNVPNKDYSSPGWVTAVKGIAFLMENVVPGASYVKQLNNIADNSGSISACPNMMEDKARDILEKKLDKTSAKIEGKMFSASNMGHVDLKKPLSIGKGATKFKVNGTGIDMINVLAEMMLEDIHSQIDELSVALQIATLVAASDYDGFINAALDFNDDNPKNPVIIIYSNKPIVSVPGETLRKEGLTPSYDLLPSTFLADRSNYNGFVSQYISWGFKSSYTGNSMVIMKTIKINYE